MQTTFTVQGMHCASCKHLIEDISSEIPGVESASLDENSKILTLTHSDPIDIESLKKEISSAGSYTITQL